MLRLPLIRRAPVSRELEYRIVLRQGLRLHRRLLRKTLLFALVVFAPLEAPVAFAFALHAPAFLVGLLAVLASCVGLGLLQGLLAELVWDQHEDGDAKTTLLDLSRRFFDRLGGIATASAVFVVPGFGLSGRRLLTVPVLVLAEAPPARAAFYAGELASVNEPALRRVAAASAGLAFAVQAPLLTLAMIGGSALELWFVAVAAATVAMPYVAHASFVAYYALTQPYRPIVLDPGEKWQPDERDEESVVQLDVTRRGPANLGTAPRERVVTHR